MKFQIVEFEWNEKLDSQIYNNLKEKNRLNSLGFIAQDIRQYYPQVVSLDENGYYTLDYKKLNSVLVQAIKEQHLFIEDVQNKIQILETKLLDA